VVHEDLCLVDQSAKRIRMNDAVAVTLELAAKSRWRLGMAPATTLLIDRGVRRERLIHVLPAARLERLTQGGVRVVAGHHRFPDGLE